MRLKTLLFISLMMNGCGTLDSMKVNGRYLVVSAVHYTRKYTAFPDEEREEIRFTLKHGKTTIIAHCQMWDIKNNCAQLEVGRDYEMKPDRRFSTLLIEDRHIVLAVEKETLGPSE
jgi:hypothetical protein